MNLLTKLGFKIRQDDVLLTDPTRAIPIAEQNRLKKAGYDLNWISNIQTEGGLVPDDDRILTGSGPFSILTITKYQSHPKLMWLMEFSHQNNAIMLMDVGTNEPEKVISRINRSINELQDQTRNGRFVTDQDRAATEERELREYAASLSGEGEISKSILIRLLVFEPTQEELERHVSEIKRDLRSNGYHAIVRFFVQNDQFKTINEPLTEQLKTFNNRGIDTMHDIQDIRSRVLGGGANMNAQQLIDPHGIMLGSTSTGGAFIFDQFRSTAQRTHFNYMVLGSMGAGKSTLLKMIEEGSFARDMYIRAIDKTGEYNDLFRAQGGKIISLDGKKGHKLNPLQVLPTVVVDQHNDRVDEAQSFHHHLTKVRILVKMISNDTLNEYELNEFSSLLRIFYIKRGLLPPDWSKHPEKIKITTFKAKDYPTFSEFDAFIKKLITPEFLEQNNISADKQTQYEHIISIVDNIVNENGDIFDGHTDIGDLSNEKILLFDMQHLSNSSEAVQRAQIYMALSMIWSQALTVGRRENYLIEQGKLDPENRHFFNVFIDECHNIINPDNLEGARYVTNFQRETRKFGAGIGFATQSPEEMAPDSSEKAAISILKEVFEFTEYKFMMKMDPSQIRKIKTLMGDTLTTTDYKKLPELERGEAIVTMSGSKERYNVTMEPTERQLKLFKGGQ
ncbi:VirB4 family type IV secretion system protein [Lactobacillus johnsonii]|jgi:DNA helicase HerA-like ATPase|uniref:ATP-binding protein n=1 Tax=Lactobacillus johnsonii TaxID=33959 RepID=A0A9X7TEP6_LACJH|nr:ATP-binding protein [Lactobacillus johnsonii]QIA88632.1 ATP-binding protein [Lactobacillus johnsonii]